MQKFGWGMNALRINTWGLKEVGLEYGKKINCTAAVTKTLARPTRSSGVGLAL